MARTLAHLNTERRAEAKLYLQRCGGLERQAHYAVRDILYHWLTFIMLNLPQTPTCAVNAKQPPTTATFHRHSRIRRQRLMGTERRVNASPCIKKTCSWKVQDKWCLPSDTFTACHSDSAALRSGGGELRGSVPLPGAEARKWACSRSRALWSETAIRRLWAARCRRLPCTPQHAASLIS